MDLSKKKNTRIKDPGLVAFVKSLPCIACLREPAGDAHHLTTKGAGGDDIPENLLPLCRKHHNQIHQYGTLRMLRKYSSIKDWLFHAGRLEEFVEKHRRKFKGVRNDL